MIQTTSQLERHLKTINSDSRLAIDTEFKRINTYYPELCLVQIATTHSAIAIVHMSMGEYSRALKHLRHSTSILRSRFISEDIKETQGLLGEQRTASWTFQLHAHLALLLNDPMKRTELISEALEVIQLSRTSSAAGALSRMAARFASGDDKMAQLIRQRQDTAQLLEGLDRKLNAVLSDTAKSSNRSEADRIRDRIKLTTSTLNKLDQLITSRFPMYADLTSREPLSSDMTQDLLASNEALITTLRSPVLSEVTNTEYTHVFIIRSDSSTAYTVELGVSEIEQMVSQLRSGIDPVTGRIKAFDVGLAHELYQRLLSPAEPMLAGVDHLFVVPDGPLESLPFHLLVTEDPGEVSLPGLQGSGQRGFTVATDATHVTPDTDVGYQDIAWLAKKYAITTLPSVSSLRALRVFAKRAEATEPFIGFGDPVLGGQAGESKGLQVASFYRGAVADVDEVRQLSSLPETETELRAMARYLGADESSIYLRERATETQVKSVTLNQSKVVAFSTHGLLSGELKGLAEPALVLTPPETGTEHDDGLLTASEVAQLKLDADWVILSACNTAAGDKPGATGLSGLAKAFFYAGARALLVSHWPVESNAAKVSSTTARADPFQ